MSTLKVDTIQNVAGGSSSTPLQLEQGRAKAWINFNGTGTVAIRDSYNVSSIVDNGGTGDYSVNFTTAFANANYAVACMGKRALTSNDSVLNISTTTVPSTTAIRVVGTNGAAGSDDFEYVCLVFFGD